MTLISLAAGRAVYPQMHMAAASAAAPAGTAMLTTPESGGGITSVVPVYTVAYAPPDRLGTGLV